MMLSDAHIKFIEASYGFDSLGAITRAGGFSGIIKLRPAIYSSSNTHL